MSNNSPLPPPTPISRLLRIVLLTAGGFAFVAILLLLWSRSVEGVPAWGARIVAFLLLGTGLLAWNFHIKILYLAGEEDEWYVLLGWDRRTVGFVRAGLNRIKPAQQTEPWRRVQPLYIKHDVKAQNKQLDSFDVHVRVRLEIYPQVVHGPDARWLRDQYPVGVESVARGMLTDVVTAELRRTASYSQVIEKDAEQSLRQAINEKLTLLAYKGAYVDESVTFVDIMVPAEVLAQRTKTRTELNTLLTIREVAHDMGISTDELLIQRALEQLPAARSRQSVGEIAAVLQLLRAQQSSMPPSQLVPPEARLETVIPSAVDDEIGEVVDISVTHEVETGKRPTTYVEGQYQTINPDPHDPDAEGDNTKSIFSPF
jgi:hypothetical protein